MPCRRAVYAQIAKFIDATQQYEKPITEERLFGWHAALFPNTAPVPERVPDEMDTFLKWMEGSRGIDPYVKAGIAHLWFESIHPFDDGNGRIGRAIADLLLARAENSAKRFYSLSSQLLKERAAYYSELESAQRYSGDIGRWIIWFLGCLTRAVETSEEKLDKAKHKAIIFEQFRKVHMNKRQTAMLNRLIDGFEGKLTTAKWAKLCKCSHDSALRDIDDLIGKGILMRSAGGGRSTSYELAP